MPLQKHLTLIVAVALAFALVSREFGAPRDVVRRRARGWLKELAESTSTLAASLEDAPSSAIDWLQIGADTSKPSFSITTGNFFSTAA